MPFIVPYRTFQEERKRQLTAFARWLGGQYPGRELGSYIGASQEATRKWIEGLFIDGMEWDGYRKKWVVMHIAPLRLFDLNNEDELKLVWYYKNLIPIFRDDVRRKDGDLRIGISILDMVAPGLDDTRATALKNRLLEDITKMNKYLI